MKILVCIKRVPDPETKIVVNAEGTGIKTDNVKWVINPFCEIALEEALRIFDAVKLRLRVLDGGAVRGPDGDGVPPPTTLSIWS